MQKKIVALVVVLLIAASLGAFAVRRKVRKSLGWFPIILLDHRSDNHPADGLISAWGPRRH